MTLLILVLLSWGYILHLGVVLPSLKRQSPIVYAVSIQVSISGNTKLYSLDIYVHIFDRKFASTMPFFDRTCAKLCAAQKAKKNTFKFGMRRI